MSNLNEAKSVSEFLSASKCVLAEPSAAFLSNISACLQQLGAKKENIFMANKAEDALNFIDLHKPNLIITEHQLGNKFGMDLIEHLDKLVGEYNRVAILATSNSSDTAIAEAAEEQIDAYILKPFSMGDFQKKIENTILKKTQPTDYSKHVNSGKTLLAKGEYNAALESFNTAKKLTDKPSLAHYYSGLIHHQSKKLDQALTEYQDGLNLSPLHYRCLIGKFETLFQQQKYKQAYELVDPLRKNYPISPKRLSQLAITATFCGNWNDMPEYFKLYSNMTSRTPELVKIMSASFRTAGKTMLKMNNMDKAIEFFELGALASQLDPVYLESLVRDLLKAKQASAAQKIYSKFPRQFQATDMYQELGFLIDSQMLEPAKAFESGRKVLASTKKLSADFYRELVMVGKNSGRKMATEDIFSKAVQAYPELRKELGSVIESMA